jgi:hypothetical protein
MSGYKSFLIRLEIKQVKEFYNHALTSALFSYPDKGLRNTIAAHVSYNIKGNLTDMTTPKDIDSYTLRVGYRLDDDSPIIELLFTYNLDSLEFPPSRTELIEPKGYIPKFKL